jgi:AcrR family transcriptional regulator
MLDHQEKQSSETATTEPHEPRWRRRKDDRPREIMEAALEMFLEKGYSATRLEDIAQKANVTKGTLFIYFENKEDLFKSLVREGIAQLKEFDEQNRMDIRVSAQESILFMVNNWWKSLANTIFGKLPKLIVSDASNFPDITQLYIDEVMVPGRRMIAEVIQRGIDAGEFQPVNPEYAARLITAPLIMMSIWRHSGAKFESAPLNDVDYLNTHINVTLNGLVTRPAARASDRALKLPT